VTPSRRITELDAQVALLPAEERERFDRIFHLSVTTGHVVPPQAMHAWITGQFGSVRAVRQQRIVKVTNRITLEGALFNELRARRPLEAPPEEGDLQQTIRAATGGPFCHPETGTPADTFGRIRGGHALTASNVAKYDGWHGVIIFDEHNPLHFTAEQVADYVDTAQQWASAAHRADPEARYPFFLWNCLWRSGASILHGHAQMTLTRGMHYARVESWRQAALRYRDVHGVNYFDDLVAVYRSLGLGLGLGTATIFPSLTPLKEKETHIIGRNLDEDLKSAIFLVLSTLVERLGTQSFNLAIYQPPLTPTREDWGSFPTVVRVVDRGSLESKTADLGAMELFGQSVVATDPFFVAEAIFQTFSSGSQPA
jgi:hypothetical protein